MEKSSEYGNDNINFEGILSNVKG